MHAAGGGFQRVIKFLLGNLADNLRPGLFHRNRVAAAHLIYVVSRRLKLHFGDFARFQGVDVLLHVRWKRRFGTGAQLGLRRLGFQSQSFVHLHLQRDYVFASGRALTDVTGKLFCLCFKLRPAVLRTRGINLGNVNPVDLRLPKLVHVLLV